MATLNFRLKKSAYIGKTTFNPLCNKTEYNDIGYNNIDYSDVI